MTEDKYAIAESLLKTHEYKQAFSLFQAIALDENNSNRDRASAYNMMGVIVSGFDPSLAPGDDESGLEYYKAALAFDEDDLGVLLNIAGSFGDFCTYHQDIAAFKTAYDKLMLHQSELIKEDVEMLQRKYNLMQIMLKKDEPMPPSHS